MSRAKRVCLALIMLVEASAVSSFPAWMKERYKELIEIAKEPNGAQQVADLYGSVDIQGLAQAIDAAWSQTPNLERKPAVRAISGREIEISYLVVPSTSISMYSEMISNPEHLRDATQGVLQRLCAVPSSAVFAKYGYTFSYKFWNAGLESYGPMRVDVATCNKSGPFATQ